MTDESTSNEHLPTEVASRFADLVTKAVQSLAGHLSYDRTMEVENARARNDQLSTMIILAGDQADKARLGELLAWGITRDGEVETLRNLVATTCSRVCEWMRMLEQSVGRSEASLKQQIDLAQQGHEAARQQLLAAAARMQEHAQHNPRVRQKVFALTSGHCIYCNVELLVSDAQCQSDDDRTRLFHVDHIVPKASGGPDHVSNYVPACAKCNNEKRDMPVADFITLKHMKQGKLVLMRVMPDGIPTEAEFARVVDAVRAVGGEGRVTDDDSPITEVGA